MAHSALHFGIGLSLGTACMLLRVAVNIIHGKATAAVFRLWLPLSYLLGALAITPALLTNFGLSPRFCAGWWMNIFIFHPLVNRLEEGGMLIGEIAIVGCFVLQYGCMVLAMLLWKKKHISR